MRKNRFHKTTPISKQVGLSLAPMASIFTVILVFLLRATMDGVSSVTPGLEMTLPELKEAEDFQDAVKIEVSSQQILVSDKPAVALNNYSYEVIEVAENGGFKGVNRVLAEENEKRAGINSGEAANSNTSPILLMADKNTPNFTLKRVITSAASYGYKKVKFIVTKD